MTITYEKANLSHKETIFNWLSEPHIQEFWDNSQAHKEDILNFLYGRKQTYFFGTTKYFIAKINSVAFAIILCDQIQPNQSDLQKLHHDNLSKHGHTCFIDFGIGNKEYLGKGLAAVTLDGFLKFYKKEVDPLADTFFIDPDLSNPKAKRVYEKAGFVLKGCFEVNSGFFKGNASHLLVRQI